VAAEIIGNRVMTKRRPADAIIVLGAADTRQALAGAEPA